VSADLPADQALATRALQVLQGMPVVQEVTAEGRRVHVRSGDSDAVARALLLQLEATALEVTSGSLEAAFLTITGDGADRAPATHHDLEVLA
jgi:ABC-2 type transport system ATP-binding protein